MFSHCKSKSIGAYDPRVGVSFYPRSMNCKIYVELHITLLHHKYTSFGSCGLREEDFFMYFHYKPVWAPGAQLAGFIKRNTINTLLHTYYESSGPWGLGEEYLFFYVSHCKAMEANDPRGGAIFDPRGLIVRTNVKLHIAMLHTKHISFGSCGFREDFFFMYFSL